MFLCVRSDIIKIQYPLHFLGVLTLHLGGSRFQFFLHGVELQQAANGEQMRGCHPCLDLGTRAKIITSASRSCEYLEAASEVCEVP